MSRKKIRLSARACSCLINRGSCGCCRCGYSYGSWTFAWPLKIVVVVVVVNVVVFLSVGNLVLSHLKLVKNSVFLVVGGAFRKLFSVPKSSSKTVQNRNITFSRCIDSS